MRKFVIIALPLMAITMPAQSQEFEEFHEVMQEEQSEIGHCLANCGPLIVEGRPSRSSWDALGKSQQVKIAPGEGIEAVLRSVPGLQQFRRTDSRSANASGQGVTLRGLGGNASSRALVILDGVPQMDPFGGWISWTGLNTTSVEGGTVKSGGGYVQYGSGAVAGVIDLISARANIGDNGNTFQFALESGSYGSYGVRAGALIDVGGIIVQISGEAERSDGFIPIIASQRGLVDRPAAYTRQGGSLRLLKAIGNIEIQGNIRHWSDERNRGFDFSDNDNSGTDASLRLVGVGSVDWSVTGYFQDRHFSTQFGSINAGRSAVTPTLDQFSVPAKGYGARGELGFELFNNGRLQLGADWRRMNGQTRENFFFTGGVAGRNRIAGGRTETVGAYGEFRYDGVYGLTTSVSGRIDRWSISNGFRREINIGGAVRSDDRFAARNDTEQTARAAFDWRVYDPGFNDEAHIIGSIYTGWRLPTLNELFRPFRVGNDATAANEVLKPERVRGAEIGLRLRKGDFEFGITVFTNRLKKAIANVSQGAGPGVFPGVGFVAAGGVYRRRENVGAIDSKGVELNGSYTASPISVSASYSYIDSKVIGQGASVALNGLRPAQVPRHFANLGVAYDNDVLGASLTLRYLGQQFDDDSNTRSLSDAFTVDGKLSWRISEQLKMALRAENIFNRLVPASIGETGIIERAQPRTIWLSIDFDIK